MVKGAQKQMIVIKTGDSRYFDEAYFVLRRDAKCSGAPKHDMLTEANRILEECSAEKKTRTPRAWLLFALGALCGAAPTLVIFLLLL